MIALKSFVTDIATGMKGMVTHLQIEMDGAEYLRFQPHSINPKTGQPVEGVWLVEKRLEGGAHIDTPDLPVHVLGTEVEDEASGFKGTAISLVLHINGCVHFNVQPKGAQENGSVIENCNFDIRRLKGDAITVMTAEETKTSEKKNPSPSGNISYSPKFRE